jgi:hypothetical protein
MIASTQDAAHTDFSIHFFLTPIYLLLAINFKQITIINFYLIIIILTLTHV